jgi:hypothetical protein
VSIQVIETGLINQIRNILSPLAVAQMDEDDMAFVQHESAMKPRLSFSKRALRRARNFLVIKRWVSTTLEKINKKMKLNET